MARTEVCFMENCIEGEKGDIIVDMRSTEIYRLMEGGDVSGNCEGSKIEIQTDHYEILDFCWWKTSLRSETIGM